MRKEHVISHGAEKAPVLQPEIDRAPKKSTLGQQIIFGLKMAAAGGAFFFLLWLFEKINSD